MKFWIDSDTDVYYVVVAFFVFFLNSPICSRETKKS